MARAVWLRALPGRAVRRKRDGAMGRVTHVGDVFTGRHPGHVFKSLVTVTLDDATLRAQAGGAMVGDLGWFRSNFTVNPVELEEPCLPDGTPIYPSRTLTRTERQQGMADRGCDTIDEERGVR